MTHPELDHDTALPALISMRRPPRQGPLMNFFTHDDPHCSFLLASRHKLSVAGWLTMGILAILTGGEARGEAAKVKLRYQFQPGQIVRYDVSINDDYKIQVGNSEDKPYSHQTSIKNYQVKSVEPDGSAVLELTIESVKLEIHQNGDTFQYNSITDVDPKNQPVFQAMSHLVGKPHLQLRMSTRGEVSAFVPLVPGDQVPDNPGQVAFDVLLHLPEEPLAVGESWKEDFELKLPIPDSPLRKTIRMQRQYTLQQLEGPRATIELQTKILSILDSTDLEMQLLRRQPGGTVVLDLERGLLISKNLKQDNQVSGFEMGPSLMHFKQQITEKLHVDQTAQSTEEIR